MPNYKIISSELMKDSSDIVRYRLGNYWETFSGSAESVGGPSSTYTIAQQLPITLVDDLRGFSVYRAQCNDDYIQYLEINPARIEPINADLYKPNFKIPCRLYANEENSKGDKFWQTYLAGGTWGDISYPKLINNELLSALFLINCSDKTFILSIDLNNSPSFISNKQLFINSGYSFKKKPKQWLLVLLSTKINILSFLNELRNNSKSTIDSFPIKIEEA